MSNLELYDAGRATNGRSQNASRPIDRLNIVHFVLFLHGIGSLMPWNMFINAVSYFTSYKLSLTYNHLNNDQESYQLTALQSNFLPYLGLASQVPNVLFNLINVLVNLGSGNLKFRVNLMLVIEAIIFLVTIALAVIDTSAWPFTFFYLTMASVAILNMASGVYQNCIFGTGAKFPGPYTNSILIGSNTSGTFTSTVNLITIWLAPKPEVAAIYYFVTALLVIVACIVSYNLLPLNRFFRHFDQADRSSAPSDIKELQHLNQLNAPSDDRIPIPRRSLSREDVSRDESFIGQLKFKWLVFKKCWCQCLNVYFTFLITLALFPAVIAGIKPSHSYISESLFTGITCFLVFNSFALIGNLVSSVTTWPGRKFVWILVAVRLLFVPFFLFCRYNPDLRKWPIYIESDAVYTIANALMAITSGYLSSLCMMFASSGLKPDEAPKAGMLAAFFLVFGIFSGIYCSLLLKNLVELG